MNLDTIPLELLSLIARKLPNPLDVLNLARCNKSTSELFDDEPLWKYHVGLRFDGLNFKDDRTWKQIALGPKLGEFCPHLTRLSKRVLSRMARLDVKKCQDCNSGLPDLWICTECDHIACGRTVNRHALKHFDQVNHPLVIKKISLDIWCYCCQRWCGMMDCDSVEAAYVRALTGFLQTECGIVSDLIQYRERRDQERIISGLSATDEFILVDYASFDNWRRFLVGNGPPPETFTCNPDTWDEDAVFGSDFYVIPAQHWPMLVERYPGSHGLPERYFHHRWDIQEQILGLRAYLIRMRNQ